MNFETLLHRITETQRHLQQHALASVDRLLTMRNWLIGCHIVEFEQNGQDRAEYGKKLLAQLSADLTRQGLKGFSIRNLKLFRQFYCVYPQIGQTVSAQFQQPNLSAQLAGLQHLVLPSPQAEQANYSPYSPAPEVLLRHFSFSHFVEFLRIDDPLKRAFYEIEALKGNWSVRQLQRQIGSLLYERTGLSTDKAALLAKIHQQQDLWRIEDAIRDPYILEFTGLQERPEYSEYDLETALLTHLQAFLLELGRGFCFEARQKRITIDNEHDRVDLVFYHRILRCHVLLDLKVRPFQHGDAGQMNFYLNYFKDQMMTPDDNLPVGIILCTDKNETKVRYATGGLDNRMFVSKYLVLLPSEEELAAFIRQDRERLEALLHDEEGKHA